MKSGEGTTVDFKSYIDKKEKKKKRKKERKEEGKEEGKEGIKEERKEGRRGKKTKTEAFYTPVFVL